MKNAAVKISILAIALLLLPSSASAISNGEPDGTGHPSVGFLAVQYVGFPRSQACTGTLVAPGLFLTSAHCVIRHLPYFYSGEFNLWVGFDPIFDRDDPSRWIPVTEILPNPAYDGTHASDSGDLALLRFDPSALPAGVVLPAPVDLPPAGLLDSMKDDGTLRDTMFTLVGYGVDWVYAQNKPDFVDHRDRRVATAMFMSLGPGYFRVLEIPQLGNGGICYGDSGGPFFLPDTNLQVGVTGLTDAVCRANGGALRLDTESSRAFLGQFLSLP